MNFVFSPNLLFLRKAFQFPSLNNFASHRWIHLLWCAYQGYITKRCLSVLLSQCPTQWHPPHQVPQTLVWVRHRPRPLRTLWLWSAGDDTPTQAYSSSLFPLTTDSTQCLLWGHDKTKTLQNSIHFVPVSVDSYCWNLIAPSVMAHGRHPHTYGLDSRLRKHEELSVSHHRAPSLVCFYFISLPPLCSCAFPPLPCLVWLQGSEVTGL